MSSHQGKFLSDLLPDNIITEILTKLPAKPLARFKCVSKNWNSHISTPYFLKSYTSHSSPPTWVILDRVPQLANESTHYETRFNLLDPPNVSTLSINPHKLAVDPVTDTTRTRFPSVVLHTSNGLILFTLFINRDPHLEHKNNPNYFLRKFEEEILLVVNPVTNEWLPIPKARQPVNKTHVGFATKVDPETGLVDKFMVVEYIPIIGSDCGSLMCFSSETGQWVYKKANYMLGRHMWGGDGAFEFDGRIFWVDLGVGLITWDEENPFAVLDREDKAALCRFIPVPSGRGMLYNTRGLHKERYMGVGADCIHFIEVFKEGNSVFKLWRLQDYEVGEWSLMYKVSREYVDRNVPRGFEKGLPKPCFVHPFEADIAYFDNEDFLFSLNVRTGKIESCVGFTGHDFAFAMVLPKWPSPLPTRLHAAYAKEKGNEYFKKQNFSEAIECYSKSIGLSPNAAAFANRAMSYLKVNKFSEAENDCTESLKLDTKYFKVYWRRALARKELGYLKGALEDVEFGLKLEPENKEVNKLCAELKSMLDKKLCDGIIYGQNDAAEDTAVKGN